MKKLFEVEGMHCKSCKSLIEDELSSILSIREFKVSLEDKALEVDMFEDCTRKVLETIRGLGYKAKVLS